MTGKAVYVGRYIMKPVSSQRITCNWKEKERKGQAWVWKAVGFARRHIPNARGVGHCSIVWALYGGF